MTIAISIIMIFLFLILTFCLEKVYEKRGLYFATILIDILALITSFKITTIANINYNLGIIPITTMIMIIFIYISKYKEKDIKNLIILTTISNVIVSLFIFMMNQYIPSITETISINMQGTFEYNYKILITFPIMIFVSQLSSSKLFSFMKVISENNYICAVLTFIITNIINTIMFSLISYFDIFEIKYVLFLGISTYIISLPIFIINLLLMYLVEKKKVLHE